MNILIGLVALTMGNWQLLAGKKAFGIYKTATNKNDSPLRVIGYLYSFFFAAVLLVLAVTMFV